MKINDLIETILEEAKDTEPSEQIEKTLSYFLRNDIKKVLGQNKEAEQEIQLTRSTEQYTDFTTVHPYNYVVSKWCFSYENKSFILNSSLNGEYLKLNQIDSPARFTIEINDYLIKNNVTYVDGDNQITEYQNIKVGNSPYFEYQKIIYTKNKVEMISKAYRARPVWSKTTINKFRLEDLETKGKICMMREGNLRPLKIIKCVMERWKEVRNRESILVLITNPENDFCDNLTEIYNALEKVTVKRILLKSK